MEQLWEELIMSEDIRRKELADFLKNRRQRLTPEAVGLPGSNGIRRRSSGLRREEVATLAGISLHWYTALEQGRDIRVSDSVLESLARVLHLEQDERVHLYILANRNAPLESSSEATTTMQADPELALIVNQFGHMPAYAIDGQWNLLKWNEAASKMFGGFNHICEKSGMKNFIYLLFTDPELRNKFVDWETSAAMLVAAFRTAYARRMENPCVNVIVEDLEEESAEFAEMWKRHDVRSLRENQFRLVHPAVGELDVRSNAFYAAGYEDVTLVVYTPATVVDEEQLRKLDEVSFP